MEKNYNKWFAPKVNVDCGDAVLIDGLCKEVREEVEKILIEAGYPFYRVFKFEPNSDWLIKVRSESETYAKK